MRRRLDQAIVARGLAATRTRAQQQIAAGHVVVDGVPASRAAQPVEDGQQIEIRGEEIPYVSRGGLKLAAALDAWSIDLAGRVCLDVGTSTGGFADCMLQRGAARVIGIDSGHGQLASALAGDPRLTLHEGVNARYLSVALLPEVIGFLAVDVSFIAASLVLPSVVDAVQASWAGASWKGTSRQQRGAWEAVILVKPQFEAGREFVGKHGVVRSAAAHRQAIERVRNAVAGQGAQKIAWMGSPITGGDGNREFLLYAQF